MMYKIKKQYWQDKRLWNEGDYNYIYKNFKIKRKLKWFKDKPLRIARIITVFNLKPELFNSIKHFNIIRKPRNIFINISTLRGRVLTNYSCGMLHKKGSERRTFVAFNDLLEHSTPNNYKKFKYSRYIIRIKTNNFYRAGFKRNVKTFLQTSKTNVYKFIGIKFKAHNGVRKQKKKRK